MKKSRKYEFGDGRSDRTGTVIAKNYWSARKTVKSTFGLERPFLYRINGK